MEDSDLQLYLDADVCLQDGGPEEQHLGPALVQLAHLHRLAEDLTPLVDVLGQQHLVVGVYAGLNTPVQDEFHQLVLKVGDGGVEAVGHLVKVC